MRISRRYLTVSNWFNITVLGALAGLPGYGCSGGGACPPSYATANS